MNTDEKLTKEQSISALCQFRDFLYALFSRIFREEPDKNALQAVQNLLDILDGASDLTQIYRHEHFQEGHKRLKAFFEETNSVKKNETMIADLARAYASLFLGVGEHTIGLCESVYKSEQSLLFQSSHFEAQEAYQKIGMAKSNAFPEPADHIAVELSYMARLCRLVEESIANGAGQAAAYLVLQEAFCTKHLLQWVPDLTQKIIEVDGFPFHSSTAYLLSGYIQDDYRLINVLLKEVE